MSTESEGFTPEPASESVTGQIAPETDAPATTDAPTPGSIGATPEAHLEAAASQTPETTASDAHATSVALAHESFKLRIENAYSELKTSLDNAWHVYLKDRGIETAGSEIVQDLEGSNASTGDATRAR